MYNNGTYTYTVMGKNSSTDEQKLIYAGTNYTQAMLVANVSSLDYYAIAIEQWNDEGVRTSMPR